MHDMVLRFNHAPTIGYEADVGTKTTLRIVNSQVASKPSFSFMTSPLYQNVILLAWDPSNYSSTLEQVCVMLGYHYFVTGYILFGFTGPIGPDQAPHTPILQCMWVTIFHVMKPLDIILT
jgi:hypothetical protein